MTEAQPWYKRLGPGLITAAVVLGPGSIVSSSTAGAKAGYGLVWMLVLSAVVMATFTSMGARIGCALEESFLQHLAKRWGRPIAALTGFSAFFVAAGFQFGNNLGVAVAMEGMMPRVPRGSGLSRSPRSRFCSCAWPVTSTTSSNWSCAFSWRSCSSHSRATSSSPASAPPGSSKGSCPISSTGRNS